MPPAQVDALEEILATPTHLDTLIDSNTVLLCGSLYYPVLVGYTHDITSFS